VAGLPSPGSRRRRYTTSTDVTAVTEVTGSITFTVVREGISLPSELVQRAIESYVVHMDVGSVRIASPVRERRIAFGAVSRPDLVPG
jgi:hypothetical protein